MKCVGPMIVFASPVVFAQERISDFKWQSRLLIVSGATLETVDLLRSGQAGLEERDLKVFILSGEGFREYGPKEGLKSELERRLSPPQGKPMVYLIGKDGTTTLSWRLGEFTIGKHFASIDAMPMRKREMREAE